MHDIFFITDTETCKTCGVALDEYEENQCASCEWTEDEMIIARGEDEVIW